ncbi:Aerobic cobaltochelatase subunit CobN [Acidipropionibacterium jensenii]|uniref:Aerobic cobaltochelatase subunit CobN n=1 Tax=Acidipropionibacterium jensenii TaxID=1749 RepID=A0A3S4URD5_9ACTN|nr:cobaltochelatase subunit CobN [Acidipropionibacterium jensenii]VEI03444.1 Aerobic cobaltochelatase subunit CobN [Acidipropionibacterium jensenii]
MRIVIVTVCPEVIGRLIDAADRIEATHPGASDLVPFNASLAPARPDLARLAATIPGADMVVVDEMGADPRWAEAMAVPLSGFDGQLLPTGRGFSEKLRLGSVTASAPSVGRGPMGGRALAGSAASPSDRRNLGTLLSCFHAMDADRAMQFLTICLHFYGDHPEIEVTVATTPVDGVLPSDPSTATRYHDIAAFADAHPQFGGRGGPLAVLIYSGRSYPTATEPIAAVLASALSRIARVLPIAVLGDAGRSPEALRTLMADAGLTPDLVINLMGFRLGAGPRGGNADRGTDLLREWGAAYLRPLALTRHTVEEWRRSPAGLGPAETMVSVMLPELDGCIDEIPVAAMGEATRDERHQVAFSSLVPIPDQIDRLVSRAAGLLRLRRLPAGSVRVAIVGYDYPAGEDRLLGGAFLDVAASICAILSDLSRRGYDVATPPAGRLLDDLLARAVNSPRYVTAGDPIRYPRREAERDLGDDDAWARVRAEWPHGGAGQPMTAPDGDFLIPAVEYRNALVAIQPGRGGGPNDAHDRTRPPHPQYLAFYTWLREVWYADVIIHVGTHGTLEFLASKENAVSTRDFPDRMLGGVPHIYLYYCGNPSESLIALRRSHAQLVSYQPVAMRPGGLHDSLADLDEVLQEYRRSLTLAPATSEDLRDRLRALAEAAHLPTDADRLEAELERTREGLIPIGLHVFGSPWDADQIAAMVEAVLLHGADSVPPAEEVLARQQGLDADLDTLPSDTRQALRRRARTVVRSCLGGDSDAPEELQSAARELARRFSTNHEWDGLHAALAGRHVPARLGGDVVRTPDVLPAGGGLFQFDPRRVPTEVAWRRGVQIAAGVRSSYRTGHHGRDPRSVGVVLWGLETSRTQGESFAQILSLIGARPVAHPRPGRPRFEVVPTDQLTHPRVDVIVTICGFFRDLFGPLIGELDDLFAQIAQLDEPDEVNPIAAHTRADRTRLLAAGGDTEQADELSRARIFGPARGSYGTGLTDTIESGEWDDTQSLAEAFTRATSHAYTRNLTGEPAPAQYLAGLSRVDAVSQTRSSNEYAVTDLDHYFEYLGGLTAAVGHARGHQVPVLVTDTTTRRPHTSTATEAVALGLRTRLFNPQWQTAMLAHRHRGGAEIATRVLNLVGLAATTGQVEGWMFDETFDRLIGDPEMLDRLVANNPHAAMDTAARLGEAARRGLWQADDQRLEGLARAMFEIDSDLEAAGDTDDPDPSIPTDIHLT